MKHCIRIIAVGLLVSPTGIFCMKRPTDDTYASRKRAKTTESLYRAAQRGELSTVQDCIVGGWPIDDPVYFGKNPLYTAVLSNRKDIVKTLLSAGAQANCFDSDGLSVLHQYLRYHGKGVNFSIIRALLRAGYDLTNKDSDDKLALHWAATCRYSYSLCKMLLRYGADPRAEDKWQKTPGDFCFSNERAGDYLYKATQSLEEYIAHLESDYEWTLSKPTMLAIIYNGQTPVIDFFDILLHYTQLGKTEELKLLLSDLCLQKKISRKAKQHGLPATKQMLVDSQQLQKTQEEGWLADTLFLF